jgi:hypothetical protein
VTVTNGPPAAVAGQRRWRAVIREVAGDPVDRIVFAAAAVPAGLGYSVLLPFDFTQRVSLENWQYFGPRYGLFTAGFAAGLAWLVTLQVHAVRKVARSRAGSRRGGLAGAVAGAVSLLPSLLCCSPAVPTLVGVLGLPAAARLRTAGTITYFFAVRQDWLLGGALALLAAACLWSVRALARARCLDDQCCELPAAPGRGHPEPAMTRTREEDAGE